MVGLGNHGHPYQDPEVWKKTIFILTYDENDGYFDHSPSFVAPDPKRPETGAASPGIDVALEYTYKPDEIAQGVPNHEARSGPIGMGFRPHHCGVPMDSRRLGQLAALRPHLHAPVP